MATPDSALSELSTMLLATDASLSTSLGEILATAIQELVEAELTALADSISLADGRLDMIFFGSTCWTPASTQFRVPSP